MREGRAAVDLRRALDRLGVLEALGGLVLSLIALDDLRPTTSTRPMTTSASLDTPSPSISNGEAFSSLPRWRQFLSTLNWRRDPDDGQRERQHELRRQQLASEIEQIKKQTEHLRRENATEKALSALIRQPCFADESSSTPAMPTELDCRPFSP